MDSNAVVARIGKQHYHTVVTTAQHTLTADEPRDHGGEDEGPAPTDFLRISLATCTAITLRMYADRKQWPVDDIAVTVSSRQEDNTTYITRTVDIKGALDQAQRDRLLYIANACPVHKILTHPIDIATSLNIQAV